MCCDFDKQIFIDMKDIRIHFVIDHSSEYKVADMTSLTTLHFTTLVNLWVQSEGLPLNSISLSLTPLSP